MPLAIRDFTRAETLTRWLVPPALAGLLLAGIYVSALFDEPPGWSWWALAGIVLQAYIIGEGVRAISRWLQRRLPWSERIGKRLLVQLLACLLFASVYLLLVYVPIKLAEIAGGSNDTLEWPHLTFTVLLALAFGVTLGLLQLVFDLLREWQQSAIDTERLRRATLRAELDALRAQIDPHFLFNSLNTLYGLIEQSPEQARRLVLELADVYRHVLQHGNADLVPLAQELDFVRAYVRILAARHGSALVVEIDDLGDIDGLSVPPMCLQLLIENAVRHNRVDPHEPLVVRIDRVDDRLRVVNPLRARRGNHAGTGIGLANLTMRYGLLGAAQVDIERDAEQFRVALPLLRQTESAA